MDERFLVTYASQTGVTASVAEAIGEVLGEKGAWVDVRPVDDVDDVSDYQAVVVGSAIRAGQWLPRARKFIGAHQKSLVGMPVAAFLTCMTLQEDTPENRQEVAGYMTSVREQLDLVDEGLFAGAMFPEKLPVIFRLLVKMMGSEAADCRDWDAIRAWANDVYRKLESKSGQSGK